MNRARPPVHVLMDRAHDRGHDFDPADMPIREVLGPSNDGETVADPIGDLPLLSADWDQVSAGWDGVRSVPSRGDA
jgi:hypothetical protein